MYGNDNLKLFWRNEGGMEGNSLLSLLFLLVKKMADCRVGCAPFDKFAGVASCAVSVAGRERVQYVVL